MNPLYPAYAPLKIKAQLPSLSSVSFLGSTYGECAVYMHQQGRTRHQSIPPVSVRSTQYNCVSVAVGPLELEGRWHYRHLANSLLAMWNSALSQTPCSQPFDGWSNEGQDFETPWSCCADEQRCQCCQMKWQNQGAILLSALLTPSWHLWSLDDTEMSKPNVLCGDLSHC